MVAGVVRSTVGTWQRGLSTKSDVGIGVLLVPTLHQSLFGLVRTVRVDAVHAQLPTGLAHQDVTPYFFGGADFQTGDWIPDEWTRNDAMGGSGGTFDGGSLPHRVVQM